MHIFIVGIINSIKIYNSDKWNRKATAIVALDATHYGSSLKKYIQYSTKDTLREMNKLYIGFKENELSDLKSGSFIATGNWGNILYL